MSGAAVRVTLKLATSLDGRIALASGASKWITGPEARDQVHQLRASHDAVLTGIGTVLADDPQMTARPGGPPVERQPLRVVLDTHWRTPARAQILAGGQTVIAHDPDAAAPTGLEADPLPAPLDGAGRVDFGFVIGALAARGVQSVMVEAGAEIAGAAIRSGLVDRIEWFRAPLLIGAEGRPCIAGLGLETLTDAPMFQRTSVRACGADLWETYERRP